MKQYQVYQHTCLSNGKRYVGITSKTMEERARANGTGYSRSPVFWPAIQKYGWENFSHEVLAEGLSREEASEMEKSLIKQYNLTNRENGYNIAEGGVDWTPVTGTPVIQYDFKGNFVAEYPSFSAAAKAVGGCDVLINAATQSIKNITGYGFIWRIKDDNPPSLQECEEIVKKSRGCLPVIAYDLTTGLAVGAWDAQVDAANHYNIPQSRVNRDCNMKSITYNRTNPILFQHAGKEENFHIMREKWAKLTTRALKLSDEQ